MAKRSLTALVGGCLSICLSSGVAGAADITGTVVVERKLTRRSVTVPASSYQRGAAVPLDVKPGEDPLAFERSHVVVYVEAVQTNSVQTKGAGVSSPPPSSHVTAEIQQQDRQFSPDMVVVPVGSTVSFPNLDAIFHNIFSLSKPRTFDLGNYPKGDTRTVTFPIPGIVYVYCHLHTNMSATIVVSPTQWIVRAGADGHFVLPEVPAGKYTVAAWHKAVGFVRKEVTVTASGAAPLTFDIPLTEANLKAVAKR
jgi:plastocyanin